MSRKRKAPKKLPLIDPKYKSSIIPKLINSIMYDGKKTIAERIVYEAIDKIKNFVGESVPVIESNQRMVGVITESDLFNELVSAENSRKKEELSD